jgi:GNAT superfamily N-acetyltransferase
MRTTFQLLFPKALSSLPYSHLFQPSIRHFSTHNTPFVKKIISTKKINVRKMLKEDLKQVIGWAIKEGWNPGLYEVDALYAADPSGYHLLEIDSKPVASLAGVRYSSKLAFLGLYIVKPELRGLGYGKLLWDIVMGNLKDCSAIGLNGVSDQIKQYQKEGFSVSHANTRWRGNLFNAHNFWKMPDNVSLYKPHSLTPLIDYDARLFPAPRAEFLSKWLTMPHSHVLSAVKDGELCGYGVISKANDGYKIAPLVADNQETARQIYIALCRCVGQKELVHIDTPANNPEASLLMKQFGLEQTFDTFRMYKGQMTPVEEQKWFGLTSLEIG